MALHNPIPNPAEPGNRLTWLKNLVVGCGLLVLSGWLDWRLLDGTLSYYVHPRFNLLVALASLSLTFLGGWLIWRQLGATSKTPVVSLKVVLPVILFAGAALVTTPQPLNNTADTGKPANGVLRQTSTAALQNQDWSNPGKIDTSGWSLLDWSVALNNPQRAAFLVGGKVAATGFVIQPANRTGRSFWLGRFVVVCCTADSTTLKLPFVTTRNTDLENGQWVHLQGTVVKDSNGNIGFQADNLEAITPPAQPYIYP
jgi:uncharacterized repeat protein (TIGR03943 family)